MTLAAANLWAPALRRGAPVPYWRYLLGRRAHANAGAGPYAFAHGRTALAVGLQLLGLRPGDRVLLPDLICDVVLHPLRDAGLTPVFHPVTATLAPDWPAVAALAPGARALLLVHYFGQPQDLDQAAAFCAGQGLHLLEDNAHGLGAAWRGRPLGTWGAVGLCAVHKCLPVANGGLLYTTATGPVPTPPLPPLAPWRRLAGRVAWGLVDALPPLRRRLRPRPDYSTPGAWHDAPAPAGAMDETAWQYLQAADLAAHAARRRQLYQVWQEWAGEHDLSAVFPALHPAASPLVFPARTPSAAVSRQWFDWGWTVGIDVHSWPALPAEILADAAAPALQLWRTMVCFPIHAGMDPAALRRRLARTPGP